MSSIIINPNVRAASCCDILTHQLGPPGGPPLDVTYAENMGVVPTRLENGTMLFDFGVAAPGGTDAGRFLASVCLGGFGYLELQSEDEWPWPQLVVRSEHPVIACLASQYAGWEIKGENYFAMGSGPMRAAAAREPLFAELGLRETAERCVGVLEAAKLPPAAVCEEIAAKCGVAPDKLTLLVAPTHSAAGTFQIVARSLETALHKLHELKFDLSRIVKGEGSAPLPPLVDDDLAAIGRTNDAILYGGRVTLWVRGDDESLAEVGPRVPSCASSDYGRPFIETLKANNNDFYRIDPLLFSPAQITFVNLDTGRSMTFGETNDKVLIESFGA